MRLVLCLHTIKTTIEKGVVEKGDSHLLCAHRAPTEGWSGPFRQMVTVTFFTLAWMLVGCHSQTGTFTNPFTPPDRVPPPSTQQLTPGTAQPYYPGGPIQPAPPVAGQPTVPPGAIGAPSTYGGSTFGGSTYGSPPIGTQGQPGLPTTPSVPANGWNSNSPQMPGSGSRTPAYGGQPTGAYTPRPSATSISSGSPTLVQAAHPSPQRPVQTIVPVQYAASPQGVPQSPTVREIPAAELQVSPQPKSPAWGPDQFRPQGSASVASGSTFETQPITR